MNCALVLDAGPGRPTCLWVSWIETVVGSGGLPFDPLRFSPELVTRPGYTTEFVAHRFLYAPDGSAEVVDELDEEAVRAAGALWPGDTEARLRIWHDARAAWPEVPHRAVFDNVFFDGLPETARSYGLPPELAERYGFRRRGLHGPVHRRATAVAGVSRVVSVVLDRDASVAAIVDGRPVDVSAGATPLEGVPGGFTCGDIDPAAVLYLVDPLGLSPDEVEEVLASRSGGTGLGDQPELARRQLVHRVCRYIGAYAAVMGGLDAVTLSAEPEPDDELVSAIASRLPHLGLGDRVPLLPRSRPLLSVAEAARDWCHGSAGT